MTQRRADGVAPVAPGAVVSRDGHLGRVDQVLPDVGPLWGTTGAARVRWSWAPHLQRLEPLAYLRLVDDEVDEDPVADVEDTAGTEDSTVYWVALLQGARDPEVRRVAKVTWPQLRKALTTLRQVDCGKLEAPGWMPVVLREGARRRSNNNVAAVWALVCDLDSGDPAAKAIKAARAGGFRAIWHTSWSHSPDYTKGRLVLPFDAPCPVERWAEVWQAGKAWAATVGLEVDIRAKDPSRMYFLPALPVSEPERFEWFHGEAVEGQPMKWRWLLAHYAPPRPKPYRPRTLPVASAGPSDPGQVDRRRQGRQKAAAGILRHRCERIAGMGQGAGRNSSLYGAGRTVAPMIEAGDIDEGHVVDELVAAGIAAGLEEREATTAAVNGIRRGTGEANILDDEGRR